MAEVRAFMTYLLCREIGEAEFWIGADGAMQTDPLYARRFRDRDAAHAMAAKLSRATRIPHFVYESPSFEIVEHDDSLSPDPLTGDADPDSNQTDR